MSIFPLAPIGSLLKGVAPPRDKPVKAAKRKRAPAHSARSEEPDYLALVRLCPCLSCDRDPAGVAAHVRMSGPSKPITGMATKPDDRWTLPLCDSCHTDDPKSQHRVGEVRFWASLGLDPLAICLRLHAAATGGIDAMRALIFSEREKRI